MPRNLQFLRGGSMPGAVTGASATAVSDGSAFNYFSAVCWFFGKGAQAGDSFVITYHRSTVPFALHDA
jgi:hypothetical protein